MTQVTRSPADSFSANSRSGTVSPFVALVQDAEVIDDMNAVTGWAVLGNDTTTLAASDEHVVGTNSISFAKVNGAANTVNAGIDKTIASVDLSRFGPTATIQVGVQVSSVANVDKAFVRLGTDSSNYSEWLLDDGDITAGVWTEGSLALSTAEDVTGDGADMSAITYVAVGTTHDAETDALAAILFDHVRVVPA